jgi:drug/metabolite transporter (DMT)-like permease
MNQDRNRVKPGTGAAYLLVTIVFFSTYEIVLRLIGDRVDPIQLNCIRFLSGGLILLIAAAVKGELAISRRNFGLCVLAGILNVFVSMSLINLSLRVDGASAAVSAVLFSCNPVFVSVFAAMLDRERIGAGKVLSLSLGVAGTVLISLGKLRSGTGILGPLLAVTAGIVFALYTVLGRRISVRTGSLRMNAYAFTSGGLILLAGLLMTGKPVFLFDWSAAGWVAYLSVFVTGFAYLAYFKGLSLAGAGKGSLVFFLKPALAIILAIVVLGERVGPSVFAGIGLILIGVFISARE